MICPSCQSFQSGSYCNLCDRVLFEKKKPITKIKKVSDKKALNDAIYKVLRDKFISENPICMVFKNFPSTDVHHKKGKIGKNYLDVSTFLAVCREAHRKIEDNPEWARENGYSESRLSV